MTVGAHALPASLCAIPGCYGLANSALLFQLTHGPGSVAAGAEGRCPPRRSINQTSTMPPSAMMTCPVI